jgi:glycosyltransferase involved in cell wall biosynthesis
MISTHDAKGGAARSAYRLHKAKQHIGLDSQMLVLTKGSGDASVLEAKQLDGRMGKLRYILSAQFDRMILRRYPNRRTDTWSVGRLSTPIVNRVNQINPDVLYIHWVGAGYVPVHAIPQFKCPVIWKLPDSSVFTGGCHVPYDCVRYRESCGSCPQLQSNKENDLSRRTWRRKYKHWKDVNFTVVTASHWLADCARRSSLLGDKRIEVIPNAMDLSVYRPIDKLLARELLGFPKDQRLLMFGVVNSLSNENKGFHFLNQALQKLAHEVLKDVQIVVFGANEPLNPPDLGFKTIYTGHLHDDVTLALVYSASDVMVVPSIQEAFGQTASEAMACGTPVVAFGATGLLDIVDHHETGYLAQPYEADDLAAGIAWVLEDDERRQKLGAQARKVAEERFDIYHAARMYADLYQDILSH